MKMVDGTSQLKLRSVVTEWKDGRKDGEASRSHVFVWVPSGFSLGNVTGITVNKGFVEINTKWQPVILNQGNKNIYHHTMFVNNYYVAKTRQPPPHPSPHPVAVAIFQAIQHLTGENNSNRGKSLIEIQLPKGTTRNFTTKEICGPCRSSSSQEG